jgi:hypothetical protein
MLIAFDRLNIEVFDFTKIIAEVKSNFSYVQEKEILKAMKNGALGKYGRTYKLSTQEVCFWIYSYLKEKESKRLKL